MRTQRQVVCVHMHAQSNTDTRTCMNLHNTEIISRYCAHTCRHAHAGTHIQPHTCMRRFVGRVVGKALYDGQLFDAYFTRSFYKHMLGQALTYEDIEGVDPGYYKNLVWMLEVRAMVYKNLVWMLEVRARYDKNLVWMLEVIAMVYKNLVDAGGESMVSQEPCVDAGGESTVCQEPCVDAGGEITVCQEPCVDSGGESTEPQEPRVGAGDESTVLQGPCLDAGGEQGTTRTLCRCKRCARACVAGPPRIRGAAGPSGPGIVPCDMAWNGLHITA